jgi:hypothetical protein
MRQYVLRTKFGGGSNCDRWDYLKGWCQSLLSSFPYITPPEEWVQEDNLQDQQVVEIIDEYVKRKKKRSESLGSDYLSIGDPDYRPVDFLERAFRLGAAVCRITRLYNLGELEPMIGQWPVDSAPEICKALELFFDDKVSDDEVSDDEVSKWKKYWKEHSTFGEALKEFQTGDLEDMVNSKGEKEIWLPYATGFLVGKSYLLTNYHVLNLAENRKEFRKFRIEFRYERNLNYRRSRPIKYALDPILCVGNARLDYTLIKIKDFPELEPELDDSLESRREKLRTAKLSFEKAGENFGWLHMKKDQIVISHIESETIVKMKTESKPNNLLTAEGKMLQDCKLRGISGEPVCIIQHPRGRPKEIVVFNSNVIKQSKEYLQYTTDTDFGSSGSPIFNADLQLIGMHYGALVEDKTPTDVKLDAAQGSSQNSPSIPGEIAITADIGTKINAIVADLELQSNGDSLPELSKFIKEYINGEQLLKRRIFLLGGRRRDVSGDAEFTQKIVDKLGKLLQNDAKREQFDLIDVLGDIELSSRVLDNKQIFAGALRILSDAQLPLKLAIAWINAVCDEGNNSNQRPYRPGDIALEIITEKYESEPLRLKIEQINRKPKVDEQEFDSLPRGLLAYHVGDNRERRAHAELILDKLSAGIPELRSRGALSDSIGSQGELKFCRELYMPSLVLSLGFLENPLDRKVLGVNSDGNFDEGNVEKLAKALLKALIAWSDALNPGSASPD